MSVSPTYFVGFATIFESESDLSWGSPVFFRYRVSAILFKRSFEEKYSPIIKNNRMSAYWKPPTSPIKSRIYVADLKLMILEGS